MDISHTTVHALFEHSGELIEANNGRGPGAYAESSLECNNNVLKLTRLALSRKNSRINLTDYINWLWVTSNIQVQRAAPEKHHKKIFFNSLYIFKKLLPLILLAEYYLRDLVLCEE